jgi:hypothetical protein
MAGTILCNCEDQQLARAMGRTESLELRGRKGKEQRREGQGQGCGPFRSVMAERKAGLERHDGDVGAILVSSKPSRLPHLSNHTGHSGVRALCTTPATPNV